MLLNHFKISLRQLLKNKTFSFINIFGLTLGFLCFILLALYIHDELSFDMFHRDAERIHRIVQEEQQEDGAIRNVSMVAALIGKESANQFQEVEETCHVTVFGRVTMGNNPATRDREPTITTDPNFFTFFDFPLMEGDPATALNVPNAVVLSESAARKYFGNEPALGKQIWSAITLNGKSVYMTVTGVMKDFPKTSHLQFSAIFSDATWAPVFSWYTPFVTSDWTSNSYVTYLKFRQGTDLGTFPSELTELVKTHYPKDRAFKSTFSLQSLSDIHMYSDHIQGDELVTGSIKPFYIHMFGVVGALLLLIACLNYMNLSTATALKRTREMGTRKTLGALKGQLIRQFLTDSVLLSLISFALAIAWVELLLPAINDFAGKQMALSTIPLSWIIILIVIIFASGVLSALYPAFVASRVSVISALKNEIKVANRSLPVRKFLLVAQFTISIIMIASTLVIYQQLKFLREKDLGFNVENLLVIDINSDRLRRNFETVKAEFSKAAEVMNISTSTRVPGEWKSFPVATVKNTDNTTGNEMIFVGIDKDFLKTYDIKLLEGRTIDDPVADSLKIVLTQLAVKKLGLINPIGQMIEIPSVRFGGGIEDLERPFRVEVIGVVEDFHFESLRSEMMPVIFGAPNTTIQRIDYYTVRVKTSNWDETLQKLKAINDKIDNDNPMEYTFLDNRFEEFYRADAKRGQIFFTFSIIVVLIACMGLFALVSYSVETRTKEIGVRKVLGASVSSIVGLVSKEFLMLVGLACVVAIPVSFFFMREWLKDFAYQISLGVGSFILAGLLAVLIAFITISLRTLRTASDNPVKSLRSE